MGEGNTVAFDIEIDDEESLTGTLRYVNPNYDFLEILLITHYLVLAMISQNKVMKTQVLTAGIGTSFEQFRDIIVDLGLSASYDDLRQKTMHLLL